MKYQPTIGLEIHAELKTESKMFCECLNKPTAQEPNINICPICTGQPGSLPVINQKAIEYVLKTALALNCQIPEFSKFDRKNYFYPDLPKGYQISQYDKPLSVDGYLEIDGRKIRIGRIHLEEDTGKLLHPAGADYSLVDFNRAGLPLMELVTEPDIASPPEARKFSQELQLILRYLEVSDADMEKGQLRVEANISLAPTVIASASHLFSASSAKQSREKQNSVTGLPRGGACAERERSAPRNDNIKLGTKVEVKNLNSFRSLERAIEYEIKRQTELLEAGEKVVQETRGWDENKQKTFSQRSKEEAEDYRYFPEPDLPPLTQLSAIGRQLSAELPELPQARCQRFKKEYQLPEKDTEILVSRRDMADYFEEVCSEFSQTEEVGEKPPLERLYKLAANYLLTEIPRIVDTLHITHYTLPKKITAENFAEFIILVEKGEISSSGAQAVLGEMFKTGADPSYIIEERGLKQVSGEEELTKIIEYVIKNNVGVVKDYRAGKENALQFLVGQVMRESKGKANPQIVNKILKERLN